MHRMERHTHSVLFLTIFQEEKRYGGERGGAAGGEQGNDRDVWKTMEKAYYLINPFDEPAKKENARN